LVEAAIRMCKAKQIELIEEKAEIAAEERILDILLPSKRKKQSNPLGAFFQTDAPPADTMDVIVSEDTAQTKTDTREKLRQKLRDGKLEKAEVEIEVEDASVAGFGFMPGNDDMMIQIQDVMGGLFPKQKKAKKTTIGEARKLLKQEEAQKLIDMDEITAEAVTLVEQNGIVFLDEIDKIAGKGAPNGPDVSREGVQRDILPIVEGSTVTTKYGPIKTDYILFIAAGAFHFSKVSDLIPELQGRFPIHVSLNSLTEDDFKKILTKPENAVIKQQTALLSVEDVHLVFTDDAIDEIAKISYSMNQTKENIGARRLHTVMEILLEEISFTSDLMAGSEVVIDGEYVIDKMNKELKERNLGKYIL
jgi:ATP-dependent HslUV protease ATP-binding subunit HslU